MRRDNKTRDVTGIPNWSQHERVNLGADSERVRFNEGKQGRKSRSKQGSYSASTSAWSAVSLLLLIGLIATVFFAYYNVSRTDGKFQYFSPSHYLTNIGSQAIDIPAGEYLVTPVLESFSPNEGALGARWYGYVNFNGVSYKSTNYLITGDLPGTGQYTFNINGFTFESYDGANADGVPVKYVSIPEDFEIHVNDMPQITSVLNTWQEVDDFLSFGAALGDTARFVVDFLNYQTNLLQNLLPWNSVVEGESNYLEGLWERGQS